MKLRIKGNSIRLRLSQKEVQQLNREGVVEERTQFGFQNSLTYRVSIEDHPDNPSARFDNACVDVKLISRTVAQWAETEQVGIQFEQSISDGETLSLLIEKDFKCLSPRRQEDESENYPHPKEGEINC